ncbi:MAG: hypothetical protein ACM3PC_02670 [Deltaproteobacteria bacterium]
MRAGLAIAAGALVAGGLPGGARAVDAISGYAEGGYTHGTAEASDPGGSTQKSTFDLVFQRYRLNLDREIVPTLRFNGTGLFERDISWGGPTTIATNLWNASGDLIFSQATSSTAVGYNRRQVASQVADDFHLIFGWRPLDLPTVTVRLARPRNYDTARRFTDIVSDERGVVSTWTPLNRLLLSYSYLYTNPKDRIRESETTSTTHNLAASYGGFIVPRLIEYYVGGTFARLDSEATSTGTGGILETLQSPIAGYSAVETPPALASLVTLQPNAALVNGDKTASAGVNLGTSRPLANDPYLRDVGVQFGDTLTPVNTFYVWVDRDVTDVATQIPFTAWQSDDGQHWTSAGPVQQTFGKFANRFEITVAKVQARYLKVTAAPLGPAADPRDAFRDILVTELQVALVEELAKGQRLRVLNNTTSANAGLRAQLLPEVLVYDASFNVRNTTRPSVASATTWYLINGLNLNKSLNDFTLLTGRVARQDSDQLRGHEVSYLWAASVGVNELATLSHSLSYSGQVNLTAAGDTVANSVFFTTTAVPYRGVNFGFMAGYNVGTTVSGQDTRSAVLTVDSTLQPNPKLQLRGAFTHRDVLATGGSLPRTANAVNTVEGSATFRPVRVFFVTGTVSHVVQPPTSATLFNGELGLNATTGGDLQLSVAYNSVLDLDGSITRFFTPSARWNIRPNTVLSGTYTMTDGNRGGGEQHQRTFNIDLRITI